MDQHNWKEKINDLKEMAFEYEDVSNHARAGEVFIEIAGISLRFSDYEEAEIAAQDALGQFRQQSGDNPTTGKAHRYLAACYFHRKLFEEGKEHLKWAIDVFQKYNLIDELDEAVTFLCSHLKEGGHVNEAYEHLTAHHAYLLTHLKVRKQMEDFGDHDGAYSETSSY